MAGRVAVNLHWLPERTGGAAENMAVDFLLLQRYPQAATPRFRHYGWRQPAFTFGFSQKLAWVHGRLPTDGPFDLCRRPTGGGIVDHREDWTYTLVIPRGHPLEAERASQTYRLVHEALTAALVAQGIPAALKSSADPRAAAVEAAAAALGKGAQVQGPGPAGVCFESAEIHDVVNRATGGKIAGAAQKRNKQGLLFQGSIWRPAAEARAGGNRAAGGVNWEQFGADFAERLAAMLSAALTAAPWPELNEDELAGLVEQYSSPEWLDYR